MADRCELYRDRLAELQDELQSLSATPVDERDRNYLTVFRGLLRAVRKAESDLAACLHRPPLPDPAWPLAHGPNEAGFRLVEDVPVSPDLHFLGVTRPCPGGRFDDDLGVPVHDYVRPAANKAVIYYPAWSDGQDELVRGGGPFRVLVFGHGRREPACIYGWAVCPDTPAGTGEDYRQFSGVLEHLARWGFVSIAPDLSWLAADGNKDQFARVIADAVGYIVAENRRAGSPLRGRLNTDGIGLIGHSTAGYAAVQLAVAGRLDIDALALLAPAGGEDEIAGFEPRPVLVVHGANDTGGHGDNGKAVVAYAAALARKHLVTIDGANHFGFYNELCLVADGICTIGQANQQLITAAYLTAFFRRYLQGATAEDDYLTGTKPIEQLEGFNIVVDAVT